jgi:large subunit ribosomal protein L32e
MKKKFLRTDTSRYSKLGKNRKKLQKWRGAKGRDNKIRLKRFGYPVAPTVGHKSSKKESGKINGKKPEIVYNLSDLQEIGKNSILIIGKIGAKKKLEVLKKATEMKLEILNIGGSKDEPK